MFRGGTLTEEKITIVQEIARRSGTLASVTDAYL
jgi:hypothetical protein